MEQKKISCVGWSPDTLRNSSFGFWIFKPRSTYIWKTMSELIQKRVLLQQLEECPQGQKLYMI